MKHRRGFNPLERMSAHRKALLRNMVTSLFREERISTTRVKALAVRRSAEKLITRAKTDTVHNRRIVSSRLFDEGVGAKLFTVIAPRMKDRPGGYTRIIKLGQRPGDASEMVVLELVDYVLKTSEAEQKKAKRTEKAAKKKEDLDEKKKEEEKKKESRKQTGKAKK
ncbi:MAG: 50S ribosomal protein L17 [Treponema sp.]|jgi:large subunit ribosomal protein L17|nr:50S ribosomal protein L17 [Treponema sp.]